MDKSTSGWNLDGMTISMELDKSGCWIAHFCPH